MSGLESDVNERQLLDPYSIVRAFVTLERFDGKYSNRCRTRCLTTKGRLFQFDEKFVPDPETEGGLYCVSESGLTIRIDPLAGAARVDKLPESLIQGEVCFRVINTRTPAIDQIPIAISKPHEKKQLTYLSLSGHYGSKRRR